MNTPRESLYWQTAEIKIDNNAPSEYHPGCSGFVTTKNYIDCEETSSAYNADIDTWVYTIRLTDNTLATVPEKYIFRDNTFTWGDSIIISNDAPEIYRPGEYGAVVAMTLVSNEIRALKYNATIGTWTYLVEYIDGTDCEIPERYLVLDLGEN